MKSIMIHLRSLEKKGFDIAKLFLKKNWRNIALYGHDALVFLALDAFKNSGVNVKAVINIDAAPVAPYWELNTVNPEALASMNGLDAVLVCAPVFLPSIYQNIRRYSNCAIVDFRKLACDPAYLENFTAAQKYVAESKSRLVLWEWDSPLLQIKNVSSREKQLQLQANGTWGQYGYQHLPDLIYDLYDDIPHLSRDYLKEILFPPASFRLDGLERHHDIFGEHLNIVGGLRVSSDQPETYAHNSYLFGPCHAFGYFAEDRLTLASHLQRMFLAAGMSFRMINHGHFGTADFRAINRLSLKPGDVVIFLAANIDALDYVLDGRETHITREQIHPAFERPHDQGELFLDVGHCNHKGYYLAARHIFKHIANLPPLASSELDQAPPRPAARKESSIQATLDEYLKYLETVKFDASAAAGAIVANCNPFSRGHRYLIEKSLEEFDNLYVFCVEEDRSEFSFEERFQLLCEGVGDLPGVRPLRGGKLIISMMTFPEYFHKAAADFESLDPAMDLELFGRHIAPALNIKTRFVGTEPNCRVTRAYNARMREILPRYGIEVRVVERLEHAGEAISASKIRAAVNSGDIAGLAGLAWPSTYAYLKEKMHQLD